MWCTVTVIQLRLPRSRRWISSSNGLVTNELENFPG